VLTIQEREMVGAIRQRAKAARGFVPKADVDSLLAIIDRLESSANEGLTEEEVVFLTGLHPIAVVAKLKAQAAINAGIASDALTDRGLERLEEVERRVAGECVAICVLKSNPGYTGIATANYIADAICRRFGLPVPKSKCSMCGDTGRIVFTADDDIDCPSCRPTGPDPMPHCRQCGGSGWDHIPERDGGQPNCGACGGSGFASDVSGDPQYNERRDRRLEGRTP